MAGFLLSQEYMAGVPLSYPPALC